MAKTKKNTSVSTAEMIAEAENALVLLMQQKSDIEAKIKEAKNKLADYNRQLQNEQLNEIAAIAEKSGITVVDILAAFRNGEILELIPAGAATTTNLETPASEQKNEIPASAPETENNQISPSSPVQTDASNS